MNLTLLNIQKKDKNVFQKELARLEERLKDLYKETPDKIKKEEI